MSAPMQPQQAQHHRSRLQDDDPAYLRLKADTQKKLSASVQRLVGELRGATAEAQRSALSAFVTRQTGILQRAYITSHQMGAFDYFSEVSQTPERWSQRATVDPERIRKALTFYAPSVAKMANEALMAVQAAPQVHLEEVIEDAIKLFGGFHIEEPGGPRGGTGGLGGGADRAIYGVGHRFAGSRPGEHASEHNAANIHEHLAAQRHGEAEGGGPNAGAARHPYKGVKLTREQVFDLNVQSLTANKPLDLHGADLRNTDLSGMGLTRANLSGANLRGANLTHTYLYEAHLVGADLRGANLTHANLGYANLRGADLRGAEIKYASLQQANFRGANLEGLDFSSVQAPNANFYQANLRETTFRDMSGYGMKFHGADLTRAEFTGGSRLANSVFHEATMDGARFTNLNDATSYQLDFAGATLVGAHFEMEHFENFRFAGADLEGARFLDPLPGHRPKFTAADFTDANLTNTDLQAVFWRSVFTDANWEKAFMDKATFHEMAIGGVVYNAEGQPDNSIMLGFGFHIEEPGAARGGLGGLGGGADRAIYGRGHRFEGSRPGEHQAARIHEHLAAMHHGGSEEGGGASSHSSERMSAQTSAHSTEGILRARSQNAARQSETRFGQNPQSRVDETGQQMSFSHGEFRLALTRMRPLDEGRSGVNQSGFIKIGGKDYFAKAVVDAYYHPQEEAIHEVVANHIAKMMGLGSHVPAESYYLHFNDIHWNVMTLERGVQTFAQMENGDGRFHAKLERALRHPDAIKEMLFEYIVANSYGDRHEGNVMFQPTNERIIHIDFGRAFPETRTFNHGVGARSGIVFKPYSSGYISRLWATQFNIHREAIDNPTDRGIAEHVKIPHADLASIRAVSQRILDMAERSGLGIDGLDHLDALQTRLNVLEELSFGGDRTAADLIDTAESYAH